MIIEYLEENFEDEVENLKKSFRPIGPASFNARVIIFLLENGHSKAFSVARELDTSQSNVEEAFSELAKEDLIDFEERGAFLSTDLFDDYQLLKEEALIRIGKLGYEDKIDLQKLMEKLIKY